MRIYDLPTCGSTQQQKSELVLGCFLALKFIVVVEIIFKFDSFLVIITIIVYDHLLKQCQLH